MIIPKKGIYQQMQQIQQQMQQQMQQHMQKYMQQQQQMQQQHMQQLLEIVMARKEISLESYEKEDQNITEEDEVMHFDFIKFVPDETGSHLSSKATKATKKQCPKEWEETEDEIKFDFIKYVPDERGSQLSSGTTAATNKELPKEWEEKEEMKFDFVKFVSDETGSHLSSGATNTRMKECPKEWEETEDEIKFDFIKYVPDETGSHLSSGATATRNKERPKEREENDDIGAVRGKGVLPAKYHRRDIFFPEASRNSNEFLVSNCYHTNLVAKQLKVDFISPGSPHKGGIREATDDANDENIITAKYANVEQEDDNPSNKDVVYEGAENSNEFAEEDPVAEIVDVRGRDHTSMYFTGTEYAVKEYAKNTEDEEIAIGDVAADAEQHADNRNNHNEITPKVDQKCHKLMEKAAQRSPQNKPERERDKGATKKGQNILNCRFLKKLLKEGIFRKDKLFPWQNVQIT